MKAQHSGGRRFFRLSLALMLAATSYVPTVLAQPVQATALQLPDGSVCQWAGNGATASFNGQRVTYTCGSAPDNGTVVILGPPTFQNGAWVITEGIVEPSASGQRLRSSQTVTMDITHVNLVDGLSCDFTGSGGGVTVEGKRLNYICGGRSDIGLLGDFNTSNQVWTAERVHLTGSGGNFTVAAREQVGIALGVGVNHGGTPTPGPSPTPAPQQATNIKLPDGSNCLFAGTGATASFNGQRVSYTCGPASNNGTTVLLGTPTFQNGQLVVTEGITDPGPNGPTLRSSQQVTMSLSEVDLVDNTVCTPAAPPDNVTVENKQLGYTCGRSIEGVLGDFNISNPPWTVDKVILQTTNGTTSVQSRDTVGVRQVVGVAASQNPQATTIVLPDGTVCLFSGSGATLAFNGQRVNYNCGTAPDGTMTVILGNPTTQQTGDWVVQIGHVAQTTGGGFTLAATESVTMQISRVDLVDASTCLFAGTGATVVVNGQRMNYTCGQPNVGLIGSFNTSNPLWTAMRVYVAGPTSALTVTSQDQPGIRAATGQALSTQPAPPAPPQPAPGPVPPQTRDGRYFAETNFRVGNDAFWNYFQSRGAIDTFGFPVSRQFGFLGCQVQIFQRSIMQQCGDNASVALLNLLDPELFPYTQVNGSVFPPADDAIKNRTPVPGTPGYDQAISQFVEDVAPDTFEGQPVNYFQTFNETGGLEIWGAPISRPAYDPSNRQFIYQRFQRGIMHFAVGQGTRGILLADYLKSILLGPDQAAQKGANLPADLNAQAKGSAHYAQYCPNQAMWLCRPNDLPGTDLTYAFEAG
jgi:hypothetical protein